MQQFTSIECWKAVYKPTLVLPYLESP